MHIDKQDPGYVIVKAYLIFTQEDLSVLSTCAKGHYDHKCKAADTSGIVNAIRNSFDTPHECSGSVAVDSQDIGLMRKILEGSLQESLLLLAYMPRQRFCETACDLDTKLQEALRLMGDATRRYDRQLMHDLLPLENG